MFVKANATESFQDLKEELDAATKSWKQIAQEKADEVDKLLEDMATDYVAYIDEISQKESTLKCMMAPKGKMIRDEVGKKQAKRKMKVMNERTKAALLFAETFGLMPQKVITKNFAGENVSCYTERLVLMYVLIMY